MAKLTEKERISFESIFDADIAAINSKFMNQLKDLWAMGREEIKKRKGYDKLEEEKESLKQERDECEQRIHEIESECCFCKTKMGALIRLHQGWCCAKCFKEIVLKPEVDSSQPLDVKQEGGNAIPPTVKTVGIRPTIL